MLKKISISLVMSIITLYCHAVDKRIQPDVIYPVVLFETTIGDFKVELDRRRAPLTVERFLTLVVNKEYDGTIFHRVMPGFVAQAGGYDKNYESLRKQDMLVNESGNGLKNSEGSLAMARMNDPHSATRQFFFNLADNKHLDPGKNWGYTVFGEIDDTEVLAQFATMETTDNLKLNQPDVPVKQVVIKRITLLPYE